MGRLSDVDAQKRAAAEAAVALVEDGMALGLGSGSTMIFAVQALARRVREEGLQVRGVATSVRTEEQARGLGIPLTDFASVTGLDLAIDGADEVEAGTLRLIKGLGRRPAAREDRCGSGAALRGRRGREQGGQAPGRARSCAGRGGALRP